MPLGAARLTLLAFQAAEVVVEAEVIRKKLGVSANNSAQVDTAQSKFGGASLLTNRANPDYLSVQNDASSLDLGSGDWTIEFFMRPTSLPGSGGYHFIYDARSTGSGTQPSIGLTNAKVFFYTAGGFRITGATTLSTNTMYHVALVKSGSTTTLYLDGTSDGTYSDSNTYDSRSDVRIGANFNAANGFTGNLDEFRVSNTARYTSAFTPTTTPFQNDDNTKLLLHMNGTDGSTFFEDDNGHHGTNRTAVTLSANGQVQIDTAKYKFGSSSAQFDGADDKITGTLNTSIGTGDFTWECWLNFTDTNGGGLIAVGDVGVYLRSDEKLGFYDANTSTGIIPTGSATLSSNTWYHIAATRESDGYIRLYIDGTLDATSASTFTSSIGTSVVLGELISTIDLLGHIDEVRVSNIARYTTGFTAPTSKFRNDSNTLLLMHMEGADGSTTFTDDNTSGRAQTSLIGLGTADIDTAQSKFGGTSFYVDGTGGDGVVAYLPSNPTAITIEGWYRFDGVPSSKSCMFAHNRAGTGYGARDWFVTYNYVLNDWSLNMKDDTATTVTRINSTANNHEDTNWHHLAVCMEIGGYARLFIDGDLEEEVDISGYTFSDWTATGNKIWLGHWYASSNNHECYYDEFRISDTVRYTTSFTAPTAPFVNDANTLALLHADGTNGSQDFRDDNGDHTAGRTGVIVSAEGNAQVDTAQSQFGGTSALFDGTGDYLQIPNNSDFDITGGDFTAEAWVRATNNSSIKTIFGKRSSAQGWWLVLNSGGPLGTGQVQLAGWNGSSATLLAYSDTIINTNTWYHIAVVKDGSNFKLFVNGSLEDTQSDPTNLVASSNNLLIGRDNTSSTRDWNGHIDEVRFSNTARYTAAFTAPTEPFTDDANTLLLLHMDGADGSTSFVDDVGGRSAVGVFSNGVDIATADSKFGGASIFVNNNNSTDNVEIDDASNTQFRLGSTFTIEGWFKPQLTGNRFWCFKGINTSGGFGLGVSSSRIIFRHAGTTDLQYDRSDSDWQHIAFVSDGTNKQIYYNGSQVATTTASLNITDTTNLSIGNELASSFGYYGYIDEVRISNTARYTGSYSIPTEPFQNDANTLLLLHMNGTDGSTTFIDDNGKQA